MVKNILVILLLLCAHSAIAETGSVLNGLEAPQLSQIDPATGEEPKGSIGYDTLNWLSMELREVIFKIYEGFTTIVSPILYLVTALTILGVIVGYIIGKPPHLFTVISIFVVTLLLRELVMDSGQFNFWIYVPLNKIMFGIPSFIIQTATSDKFSTLSSNPLQNMFMQMDATIGAMANVSKKLMANSSLFSHVDIWVKAFLLQIVFFALQVVFSYVFLMAIWSMHMLLAAVPIALCLAVHPKTRKYIFNIINHASSFLITPAMASIAMAITISMLSGMTDAANALAKNGDIGEFPDGFFWHAMFLGIMSIFFHLKATSFASMIVGVADTGFGQLFGSAVAMASMGAKAAVSGGLKAGGGLAKGLGMPSLPSGGGVSGNLGYAVGKGGRLIYNTVSGGNK